MTEPAALARQLLAAASKLRRHKPVAGFRSPADVGPASVTTCPCGKVH